MRTFVCLSLLTAVGCGEDLPAPQINGVFPASGFIGRSLRVEVSGDSAEWSNGASLDFGAGVMVSNISVASPSALFADLTIAADAAPGKKDVTVTDGGKKLVLTAAFDLRNPIETESTLAEGGLGTVLIKNLDVEHPFSTTATFTATAGDGVLLQVNNVTPFEVTAAAAVDVGAKSGPLTLNDGDVTLPGGELMVMARAPMQLTPGTPLSAEVLEEGTLFQITANATGLLSAGVTTDNPDGVPFVVVLPASGKFADALGGHVVDNRLVTSGEKFYYVMTDNGSLFTPPMFGYQATVTPAVVSTTGVTAVAEAEPNDAANQAQVLTGPTAQFNGALATATDADLMRIAVTANQKVRVFTTSGPDNNPTDTVIEILDGNTVIATSDDLDFGEAVESPVITANKNITVRVTASSFKTPNNSPYNCVVVVE